MRLTQMFTVLLAIAGAAIVTPATAATSTTKIATSLSVESGESSPTADQYRSRRYGGRGYGYRSYGYRGYGNRRGWSGGYRYRPRYYNYRPVRRWRVYRPYRPRYYYHRRYRRW